ncbi:MAG TPA: hypothetical protein VJ036_04695 [bacterium]|nr:hypothetical protein [bacterium]
MSLSSLDIYINLYRDGDKLFDLLKAAVRDWHHSPWPHEQERGLYARELFIHSLKVYKKYLDQAHQRAQSGFFTPADRKILTQMEQQYAYWENKLQELTGEQKPALE